MPATFSSATTPAAPCVYASNAVLGNGGWSTGIGLGAGAADGTALTPNNMAIGGAAIVLKVDTDGNAATP